ncbi:hypothetical protein [Zooshikella harenae]|nr:hypothetical protein [Zooshikella harenae]
MKKSVGSPEPDQLKHPWGWFLLLYLVGISGTTLLAYGVRWLIF